MIEQFFDTIKNGYKDPSKYKCWKLFWATLMTYVAEIYQIGL